MKYTPYYRCRSIGHGLKCGLPHFPANKVDGIVWQWLEDILADNKRLEKGLGDYQKEQKRKADPIQKELRLVDELLKQKSEKFDESLDTLRFVPTPPARAKIAADIEHIEGVLDRLETKKANLIAQLEQETLTEEQLIAITEWASIIAIDLETIRQDF